MVQERGKLHIYLINEAITSNENLRKQFILKYEEWRNTIKDGLVKVLKNKNHNYEILSYAILTMIDGFTIQYMLGIDDTPMRELANFLVGTK